MVLNSSNINNTNIHLSSYRNSLNTKRTMTYDVGNTGLCLEHGQKCGGLTIARRVPLVQQKMHTLCPSRTHESVTCCCGCRLIQFVQLLVYPILVLCFTDMLYSIQHYRLKFVSDFRYVGSFIRFTPPIKTDRYDI